MEESWKCRAVTWLVQKARTMPDIGMCLTAMRRALREGRVQTR